VFVIAGANPSGVDRKFYDDDPLVREPESQDAAKTAPYDPSEMYELFFNLFVNAADKPSGLRAQNINTIDEVPDSSWFTNRIGRMPIRPEDVAKGPNVDRPPASERWTIVGEKASGAKPGFTARDANGVTWFVQFDDPERYEASTGAVEVATKIFWTLGYNQVETFLTTACTEERHARRVGKIKAIEESYLKDPKRP